MKELVRSFLALLVFIVLLGFGYTGLVAGIANALWPAQAQGSLVTVGDRVVGSELLAQPFTDPGYFWPRPSASGFNANAELEATARALAYPSNLGPTNPELIGLIEERVATYGEGVPVDLVTASGSGLDPHISLAAARWQAPRVAEARQLELEVVMELIDDRAQSWLGRRYVNVLLVNLALDQATESP
ncbi:MAG TPA: potassium-transporting ATPase subunit KdpC [Acidimicrobiia bacterium]|nr:potassium-transporting ATPase subunit KdpC [Acidimicrobiia bacterium]